MAIPTMQTRVVEGIMIPDAWDVDTFTSALNYKAQPDDIFLVVYPKSGTTWMQVILYSLLNNGQAFDENMADYFAKSPYIDPIGEKGIKSMHRPFVMKTHLPFDRVPYNANAKYICLIRNPKDVCVSYFFFLAKFFGFPDDKKSFDNFFELFISGQLLYGNYFDHITTLWKYKNDENVFLTSYEQMKKDLPTVIRHLTKFLQIELNPDLLNRILTVSSFDYMKDKFDRSFANQAQIVLNDPFTEVPLPMNKILLENADRINIVREGQVGKWSSIMTPEQTERIDSIFTEKLAHLPGISELLSV